MADQTPAVIYVKYYNTDLYLDIVKLTHSCGYQNQFPPYFTSF